MSEETTPALRVVRGDPTDAELAAVTAILLARGATAEVPPASSMSGWAGRADGVRRPLPKPGPGAWRASGR